jgi:hypothetical protein
MIWTSGLKTNAISNSMDHAAPCGFLLRKQILWSCTPQPGKSLEYMGLCAQMTAVLSSKKLKNFVPKVFSISYANLFAEVESTERCFWFWTMPGGITPFSYGHGYKNKKG